MILYNLEGLCGGLVKVLPNDTLQFGRTFTKPPLVYLSLTTENEETFVYPNNLNGQLNQDSGNFDRLNLNVEVSYNFMYISVSSQILMSNRHVEVNYIVYDYDI